MELSLVPMTLVHAAEVVTWAYNAPYDVYDMTGASAGELADPASGFYAVLGDGALVAFRSYGDDGRVPGFEYDESALDTGGGLRPDLVGQGLGRSVVDAGLRHGRVLLEPPAFRVTVAAWNDRALSVCRSLGFLDVARFEASTTGREYVVLVLGGRGLTTGL